MFCRGLRAGGRENSKRRGGDAEKCSAVLGAGGMEGEQASEERGHASTLAGNCVSSKGFEFYGAERELPEGKLEAGGGKLEMSV